MARFAALAVVVGLIVLPAAVHAQDMRVPFGSLSHDVTAQVEISADELSISQADGTAIFSGNVTVGQGEMRLTAGMVRVEYIPGGGRIARIHASGGVTLVTGGEAAEAQEAVYDIERGQVTLQGNVILTEGGNAISGDRLIINMLDGTGSIEGNVRTILQGGPAQ